MRGAVTLVTVVALAQSWGVDILGLFATEAGRRVIGSAISIGVVLVAALVVWELVHGAVERYLSATDADGNAVARSGRARTLLPLVRNAVFLVLLAMVTLIVLSELGVNIAPLLAGAGVVGIAIGFGSQKLVQDIITGAFILFEDTIAVGDVVKLGGDHAGAVEAISIRAIRLRDAQGSVHTIPFSAVSTVVNLTKGFNYAVFDVGVAYREDTDRVAEAITAVGAEMRAEPKWAAAMVEPLEVLGVERFDDSAVVMRARVKTNPSDKWSVAREFNRRLKKRFDELGIDIPFPQTTVWFGDKGVVGAACAPSA
jgi:small conductance mechanosensitive channel